MEIFGFGPHVPLVALFATPGKMLQFGLPHDRIDVISTIFGLTFEEAWPHRIPGELSGLSVSFIGLQDLLRNKRASGRPKDFADAAELAQLADLPPTG